MIKKCHNKDCNKCYNHKCDEEVIILNQKIMDKYQKIIICKSGRYCFSENILWSPNKDGVSCDHPIAAITINANNVVIDLNGYTLSQKTYHNTDIAIRKFT